MRVLVLGGTVFIGRAVTEELVRAGHEVLVVHRGEHEPEGWVDVAHLHAARAELVDHRDELTAFRPDAAVDTYALTRADAEAAVAALPPGLRLVVLSSMDVYAAYGDLHAGRAGHAVPLDESSPVRAERFPYRGKLPGMDDYEKLDVEEVYRAHGATVCRLPAVFGEHDPQRREEPILRRVRAGRERIPFGAGTWLWGRSYVGDAASGIRRALECPPAAGETLNLGPRRTWTERQWAKAVLDAAGSSARLVRVPDDLVPEDLRTSTVVAQHMLVDSSRARALLGWEPGDQLEGLRRSVAWHLAHPPDGTDADGTDADGRDDDDSSGGGFDPAADDRALEAAAKP